MFLHRLKRLPLALISGGSLIPAAAAVPAELEIVSIEDASSPAALSVLYLGYQENSHHNPAAVFSALSPAFLAEGVQATFTNSLGSISASNLANYDALMMDGNANSSGAGSANQPLVPIIQEYVRNGGALVGLHVASASFRNDLRFGALLGGRFQSHTNGLFTPENIEPNHVLLNGLTPLTSFDETYILKDLNPDIHVLQERVTSTGLRYAWTWTRNEALGRVFYTASGHVPGTGDTSLYDSITKPEFPELVLRGLHWTTRRHFSAVSGVTLGSDHSVWGEGVHRPTDLGCLWQDLGSGPAIFMIEGSPVTIDTDTFFFGPIEPNTTIPARGPSDPVISYRPVLNGSGQTFPGLWQLDPGGLSQSLILTGQPFPDSESPELVESLGQTIGVDFTANGNGNSLFRAHLKNPTTLAQRSIIATKDSGIVLSEGDILPELPAALMIGDLGSGQLALNSHGNFVCEIKLSDNSAALAVSYNGNLSIMAIEGESVTGLPGVQWGTPEHLGMGNNDELYFSSLLTGDVVSGNDSAIFRYSLMDQQLSLILREGDALPGAGFAGDLGATKLTVDQNNHCHLFLGISGPLVTTTNDQVLLSIGEEIEVVVREGDSLPTFAPGSNMGSELGTTPLISDESGTLYFVADVIQDGTSHSQLFQAIGSTLFGIVGGGDLISNEIGTSFEISSIAPFQHSGLEASLPSPARGGKLAVIAETTGGHKILFKVGDLLDLDQDGFPNLMEAGIGADPLDPNVNQQFFPKIEIKTGEKYYTFLRATEIGRPIPTLEESENLETWTPSGSPVELWEDQTQLPDGFEKLGTPLNREETSSRFLRLSF